MKTKKKLILWNNHFESQFQKKTADESIVNRSVLYGKKIAQLIFEWSKTDGGHRGYLNNFDKKLVFRK